MTTDYTFERSNVNFTLNDLARDKDDEDDDDTFVLPTTPKRRSSTTKKNGKLK